MVCFGVVVATLVVSVVLGSPVVGVGVSPELPGVGGLPAGGGIASGGRVIPGAMKPGGQCGQSGWQNKKPVAFVVSDLAMLKRRVLEKRVT